MSARDFCTEIASIKRNVTVAGITTAAAAHIASLPITPIYPITRMSAYVERVMDMASSRELKECYHIPLTATLPDVKEGDLLTWNSVEYPILHVMEWRDWDIPCLQIVIQEVKS